MSDNFIINQKLLLNLLGEFNDQQNYGKLIRVQGNEAISELFHYRLTLITQNDEIVNKPLCGKDISFVIISITEGKQQVIERYFHGVIATAGFTKKQNLNDSPNPEFEYYLDVVPKLSTLSMIKNSRVFFKPEQQLTEIVEQILKQYKINYELNIKNKEILIAENCIQYNESDYEFFSRLLYAAGLCYFFKHDPEKHILIITNQTSSYLDFPNKSVKHANDTIKGYGMRNTYFQYTNHITDFQIEAFSYLKPETIQHESYSNKAHQLQQPKVMSTTKNIYTYEIKNTNQIAQLIQSQALKEQGHSRKIEGESNYPAFMVGIKFTLAGKFFENMKPSEYAIIRLQFDANINSSTEQYLNNFSAITADRLFLPEIDIVKPTTQGLHFALVVGRNGEIDSQEPYCDEHGRVYVRFLWNKEISICKAQVLSNNDGFTLPRIGSLAYILFPHNDLYNDLPVIVGISNEGLLNFSDTEEWYKNIRMTYPASSDDKLYNFIYFRDKKDKQEIRVQARKDIFFDVEHDETIKVKNDSLHSIKNIRKVIVEEGNNILEVNKGDIIIKVEAGNYSINCKGKVLVSSEDEIHLNAKSDIKIQSGGQINMQAAKGILLKTEGSLKAESQKETSIDASGNICLNTSQNIKNNAGMSASYEAGTSINIKSSAKASIESTMVEIKGKANIKVTAPFTNISM